MIKHNWCERIDALLTARQKQVRLIQPLQEPTTIEFVETPLKDVMDYLKDLHHPLLLRLDRAALRNAKMSTDMAITHNLRGVSLDSALRLMLRQVGLMHVVHDGTISITTEAEGRRLLQQGAVDPATFPSPVRDAAAKKLAEALRKPVDLEFVETPLKDVVDYLKDLCKVEIQIEGRGLEAAGVDPDAPCSINLKARAWTPG